MADLWLDDLSEDWLEPVIPPVDAFSAKNTHGTVLSSTNSSSSQRRRSNLPVRNDDDNQPLSERSANLSSLKPSQRASQNPVSRHEKSDSRGRKISRVQSPSSAFYGSVVRNIPQQKSLSSSPIKTSQSKITPHWTSHFDAPLDLFSTGAPGFLGLFQPPVDTRAAGNVLSHETHNDHEASVMPSSPPQSTLQQHKHHDQQETVANRGTNRSPQRNQPRTIHYRLVDQEVDQSSFNELDLDQSSYIRPGASLNRSTEQQLSSRDDLPETWLEAASSSPQRAQSHYHSSSLLDVGGPRRMSGQSESQHEKLSPILLQRNMPDGDIIYAPISPLKSDQETTRVSNDVDDMADELLDSFIIDDEDDHNTSHPLDDGDTDDFAHNGRFVQIGRGGDKNQASMQTFQSPQLNAIQDPLFTSKTPPATLPAHLSHVNARSVSSMQPRVESATSDGMKTPRAIDDDLPTHDSRPSTARPNSGGSPLKLFGIHDTFTNHKLQRTLSNIECHMASNSDASNNYVLSDDSHDQEPDKQHPSDVHGGSDLESFSPSASQLHPKLRQVNNFGQGELDTFEFGEDVSNESNLYSEVGINSSSIHEDFATEKGMFKFRFDTGTLSRNSLPKRRVRVPNSSEQRLVRPRSARKASVPSNNGSVDLQILKRTEIFTTPRKELMDSQMVGSMLNSPYSPIKDPMPKRRRTLHKGDIGYQGKDSLLEISTESYHYTQTASGKKRKDAREGEAQRPADPAIMAMRAVLTPQRIGSLSFRATSSSSDRQHDQIPQASCLTGTEAQEKLARIQAELDGTRSPSKDTIAGSANNQRQPSVTTSDYLTDAIHVMAALRQYVRNPELQRASNDYASDDEDDSIQESTIEPVSRPASRAGAPLRRPAHMEQNLEHLDHLQRFQDTNDIDNLTFSMKSCDLIIERKEGNNPEAKLVAEHCAHDVDVSNGFAYHVSVNNTYHAETTTNSQQNPSQRKRKYSTSSLPHVSLSTDTNSLRSNSSAPSTTRTGISSVRLGDNYKVIPSAKVSHLIPEKVKGMVYDRSRNAWIKDKAIGQFRDTFVDETDMDPFEDIPDLTIDETREQERLLAVETQERSCLDQEDNDDESSANTTERNQYGRETDSNAILEMQRPYNVENDEVPPNDPNFNGRAESVFSTSPQGQYSHSNDADVTIHDENESYMSEFSDRLVDDEKEASIMRGYVDDQSASRRKVTISFSSPIASIIEPGQPFGTVDRPFEPRSARRHIVSSMKRSLRARSSVFSVEGTPVRKLSRTKAQAVPQFATRPVSRIDEQDEESIHIDHAQRRELSLVLTPAPRRKISQALSAVETPALNIIQDSLLNLTPLSDFTVHQKDNSFVFETSELGNSCGEKKNPNVKAKSRSLSLSINNLVKNITDVEQHEPYWEHMKSLNLKSRKLQALHMLNEFCPNLEEFNVADNEIHHLDGAPPLLRRLDVSHNILSDLTSWKFLRNLQYLDVSNNDLRSLKGFKELVHLRYLKADNNKIASLEGIMQLDGLTELRLRGNVVNQIDFNNSSLHRLVSLDLKGNLIESVLNLSSVSSLVNLNLEDNKVSSIPSNEDCSFSRLKYLKLSGNQIEELDVSNYTNLRILYLDHNRVKSLHGLRAIKHLDSLSLREQHPETTLSPDIFDEASEVRKLFLSGNYLNTFNPSMPCLNLQYLELASCGIRELSPDFHLKLPNLRLLNINFNAVSDLKPLIGLTRLTTLYASGNRLTQLRQISRQLNKVRTLTMLDLRNNPMTLGFYQPHCEKRLSYEERHEEIGKIEPWMMEDGQRSKDVAWERRLDLGTAIERRIYELKIVGHCTALQMLDGLQVSKSDLCRKDRASLKMAEEGMLVFAEETSSKTEGTSHATESQYE